MSSRWWRAYDGAVDDPKLGALTDKQFRAWFNLCCICSQNGGTLPPARAIGFKLRCTPVKAAAIVAELAALKLVDITDGPATMHDWQRWQYKTDLTDPTNATRQKRYRDRHPVTEKTVTPAVTVTGTRVQSTETETETEKDSSLRSEARKRATRLVDDWWPSQANIEYALGKGLTMAEISVEAEKFRNFWTAKAGRDAAKLDWNATWQNWILNSIERGKGRSNGLDRGRDESLGDKGRRLAQQARQLELAASVGRPDDGFGEH